MSGTPLDDPDFGPSVTVDFCVPPGRAFFLPPFRPPLGVDAAKLPLADYLTLYLAQLVREPESCGAITNIGESEEPSP